MGENTIIDDSIFRGEIFEATNEIDQEDAHRYYTEYYSKYDTLIKHMNVLDDI